MRTSWTVRCRNASDWTDRRSFHPRWNDDHGAHAECCNCKATGIMLNGCFGGCSSGNVSRPSAAQECSLAYIFYHLVHRWTQTDSDPTPPATTGIPATTRPPHTRSVAAHTSLTRTQWPIIVGAAERASTSVPTCFRSVAGGRSTGAALRRPAEEARPSWDPAGCWTHRGTFYEVHEWRSGNRVGVVVTTGSIEAPDAVRRQYIEVTDQEISYNPTHPWNRS